MADEMGITQEDMVIEEGLGYPKSYGKICRDYGLCPYNHGPPFTFTPYILQQNEAFRSMELEEMFPVIDPKARPTTKPRIFISLLWKQLNHLGNAGFDPAIIRVDPYGNVVYFHADSASPLAWDIDHWFPCSRGGLTVPSNLRILQWQACKNKHNQLEFLVPWWDLQVGISVNQFLSIFAASNSDFRRRAFSFLFKEGESEELNGSQTVESHHFPQHFVESKEKYGLAPAAVVVSRRESFDPSLVLRSLDYNRQTTGRKMIHRASKENESPDFLKNPYQAIVAARDSLKQREEVHNTRAEIRKLDDELNNMTGKNREESLTIQELERELIKRRRRAEKSRRLAESQSSYKNMLEKMIRDAMHQTVVYKEQMRLNQAASSALMARLEAQKATCDASEKELHKKFKERDALEKQIRPESEKARKRTRLSRDDEDFSLDDRDSKMILYLPGTSAEASSSHKELRVFLEEEQKACEAEAEANKLVTKKDQELSEFEKEEKRRLADEKKDKNKPEVCEKSLVLLADEKPKEDKLQKPLMQEAKISSFRAFAVTKEPESEEDEESRRERGKGNVEKWLQILLESNKEEYSDDPPHVEIKNEKEAIKSEEDIIEKLDRKFPLHQTVTGNSEAAANKDEILETHNKKTATRTESVGRSRMSYDEKTIPEKIEKAQANNDEILETHTTKIATRTESAGRSRMSIDEKRTPEKNAKALKRSESARAFRRIPSSPSLILGMKKGVDCIRKKPMVTGDDDDNEYLMRNNFIKSSIVTIKRAMKF